MMKNFVYRNYTVEYLFDNTTAFSGYGDVSLPAEDFENIILFYQVDPSKTPEGQIEEIEEIKSKISLITNLISDKRIVILTLSLNYANNWQIKHAELSTALLGFNEVFLKEVSNEKSNVKVVEINHFFQEETLEKIDWRFLFTSQMIINPKLGKPFKKWMSRQLDFLSLKRKKCIVLDCDNTLWGGVVGEDGAHGVKLGQDYPGNTFRAFQELLLMLSHKGVILAVCSKNNLEDVQELWRDNTNNLINDKVLSAYRINWQNKAENIKSIAEELNIATDSFVFIDDNPIERGLVKEFLPEVEVPDFPAKAYELVSFFWKVYNEFFATFELSKEDFEKTEQYKENFFRNESKKVFENMDDYLSSLEIIVDVIPADESNINRLAQMTQKTNQFNLRSKRYTEEELKWKINQGNHIFCANVKDKFGDNGITIECIVEERDDVLFLDSYLLSCRILGREIEIITLLSIIKKLMRNTGKSMKAEYIPSKKNGMTRDFLEKVGFRLESEDLEGVKSYIFDAEQKINIKDYYTINID
ncbi:HAD-IIIC family phosphatase [Sphingobacterium sp. xlx-130]|uniref:HAD-IIIC family phosphatase n=1 Tax=Sphingobacterium sp. xlx-130 TaxID=2654323 RepID=UPI00196A1A49|nr:HAD-IIIC family phosphatase [Sphingobacterium sp. xlx-130]